MTADRTQPSGSSNRQKIIMIIFALILIVIIWQVWGMFRSDEGATVTAVNTATTTPISTPTQANSPLTPTPQSMVPQPASLTRPNTALSTQEATLLQQQQAAEQRYLSALNDLQMLRLQRDIAQTNKDIFVAKLATVVAEKEIVNLLQPPAPPTLNPTFSQNFNAQLGGRPAQPAQPPVATPTTPTTPTTTTTTVTTTPAPAPVEFANYTVVSVSQIHGQWQAVLGLQGNLYSVYVGDVLPPDGARVTSISRSGITLQKQGVRRKVSLVPII